MLYVSACTKYKGFTAMADIRLLPSFAFPRAQLIPIVSRGRAHSVQRGGTHIPIITLITSSAR